MKGHRKAMSMISLGLGSLFARIAGSKNVLPITFLIRKVQAKPYAVEVSNPFLSFKRHFATRFVKSLPKNINKKLCLNRPSLSSCQMQSGEKTFVFMQ